MICYYKWLQYLSAADEKEGYGHQDNDDGGGSGDRMLSCLHNESRQEFS